MNRASTSNYKIATMLSLMALTLAIPLSTQNAFSDGNVDQESTFLPGFNAQINSGSQRGQVFIPTADNLIAIDVRLGNGQIVGDTINISIHPGSTPSNLLLTDEERIGTITSIDDEIKHLDLDSPVTLVPGQPYILELEYSGSDINWKGQDASAYPPADTVFCNPSCGDAGFDFTFRTYFQPQIPIGGTSFPVSTTTLLVAGAQANMGLLSLALVGMVAAGAAIIYKTKSKKTEK